MQRKKYLKHFFGVFILYFIVSAGIELLIRDKDITTGRVVIRKLVESVIFSIAMTAFTKAAAKKEN